MVVTRSYCILEIITSRVTNADGQNIIITYLLDCDDIVEEADLFRTLSSAREEVKRRNEEEVGE